jgi:hypothetical protein
MHPCAPPIETFFATSNTLDTIPATLCASDDATIVIVGVAIVGDVLSMAPCSGCTSTSKLSGSRAARP